MGKFEDEGKKLLPTTLVLDTLLWNKTSSHFMRRGN